MAWKVLAPLFPKIYCRIHREIKRLAAAICSRTSRQTQQALTRKPCDWLHRTTQRGLRRFVQGIRGNDTLAHLLFCYRFTLNPVEPSRPRLLAAMPPCPSIHAVLPIFNPMSPPAMAALRPSGTAGPLVFFALVAGSASSQIWQTQDCLAAIEVESTAPTGSWQLSSAHGGFTGTGYARSRRPRRPWPCRRARPGIL